MGKLFGDDASVGDKSHANVVGKNINIGSAVDHRGTRLLSDNQVKVEGASLVGKVKGVFKRRSGAQ